MATFWARFNNNHIEIEMQPLRCKGLGDNQSDLIHRGYLFRKKNLTTLGQVATFLIYPYI